MNSCPCTKTIQSARLGSSWIDLWNKLSSNNFQASKTFSLCFKVACTYSSCSWERQTERVFEKSYTTVNGIVQATLKSDMSIKVVFKSNVYIPNLFPEMTFEGYTVSYMTFWYSLHYVKVFYGTQFWLYQCLQCLMLHWVGGWVLKLTSIWC